MDLYGDLPPSKKPKVEGNINAGRKVKEANEIQKTIPLENEAIVTKEGVEDAKQPASDTPTRYRVEVESACFGHRGRRQQMEDSHLLMNAEAVRAAFPDLAGLLPESSRLEFYGVFDGHGGRTVADFVKDELPKEICSILAKNIKAKGPKKGLSNKAITRALKQGFLNTDQKVLEKCQTEQWPDGCCAVLVAIFDDACFIANLGDSKAVLCRQAKDGQAGGDRRVGNEDVSGAGGGAHTKHKFPWDRGECSPPPAADALPLTQDHAPFVVEEKQRIEATGAKIEDGRVNGQLAVSRSFGDANMKKFGVIAEPDLRIKFSLTEKEEFIILGCDGLWSRYNEKMAVTFIRTRLHSGSTWCQSVEHTWNLAKVCRALVEDSIFEKGGQDNTSCMILRLSYPDDK